MHNLGYNCIPLKNLSLCSGGFAFLCDSIEQGFKIFESDAFISINFREPWTPTRTLTLDNLFSKDFKDFTAIPPPVKKLKQIAQKATNVSSSLVIMEIARPKFSTSTSSLRFKRINRELALIYKSPHPDIHVYPCQSDLNFWNIIVKGPELTPYEGGHFHLYVNLTDEYPLKPPEIRCLTQIYHLNINSSGRICISILNSDYGPEITILKLLQSIYGLLMNPEDVDSLDTIIASAYRNSKNTYDETAALWTKNYAYKQISELLVDINKNEIKRNVPPDFICPLTNQIMDEPVRCDVSGMVYEKVSIESFIQENGYDPLNKQPATLNNLHAEKYLEMSITRFKNLNFS